MLREQPLHQQRQLLSRAFLVDAGCGERYRSIDLSFVSIAAKVSGEPNLYLGFSR
jgi:hypothetical protein